jgi:hypothetical protein
MPKKSRVHSMQPKPDPSPKKSGPTHIYHFVDSGKSICSATIKLQNYVLDFWLWVNAGYYVQGCQMVYFRLYSISSNDISSNSSSSNFFSSNDSSSNDSSSTIYNIDPPFHRPIHLSNAINVNLKLPQFFFVAAIFFACEQMNFSSN